MIHQLDISEPIWKDRSVGINTSKYGINDSVSVTISYRDKHGNLVFPGEFLVPVSKINKYPTQKVRGNTIVHLIPIKEMSDSEKPKLESIPKGPQLLTMTEVFLETTKKQQLAKLKIIYKLDDNYFPMYQWIVIEGNGYEKFGKEKLVKMMKNAFGVDITQIDMDDPNAVYGELKKCIGEKCGILVRHEESLKPMKEKEGWWIASYPNPAFFFEVEKLDTVKYTSSTLQVPLKEEDQKKYDEWRARSKSEWIKQRQQEEANDSAPAPASSNTPDVDDESDLDLPF